MRLKRATNNESSARTWENPSLTWALISFLLKGQGDLRGGDLYPGAVGFHFWTILRVQLAWETVDSGDV